MSEVVTLPPGGGSMGQLGAATANVVHSVLACPENTADNPMAREPPLYPSREESAHSLYEKKD